eukprot:363413-Chlamydomonas_euryale.AAC.9
MDEAWCGKGVRKLWVGKREVSLVGGMDRAWCGRGVGVRGEMMHCCAMRPSSITWEHTVRSVSEMAANGNLSQHMAYPPRTP